MKGRAGERFTSSRVDWDFRTPNGLQYATGIVGSLFKGGVSMDSGDSQKIQQWVVCSK